MNGKHYLYRHIRIDTGEPFYIGLGTKPKQYRILKTEYSRAYTERGRSSFWQNITNKTEYEIEILLESDDYEFIKQKEIEFIGIYGRRDLETGSLVNLTDGGNGNLNGIVSKETRDKRSKKLKGVPRSEQALKNIRKYNDTIKDSIREREVGKLYKMKQGFFIKILEYNGNKKVLIEILGTGEKRTQSLREIKKGSIKDYSLLTCNGKGYLGKRGHDRKEILLWRSFTHKYENTYGICDNWKSFEIFIEWYNKNKKEGFCLVTHSFEEEGNCDENNTYFIPSKLMSILIPKTGYQKTSSDKVRVEFRKKDYGLFDTIEEAINKHKIVKKEYILSLLQCYKNELSEDLQQKIINYSVKIRENE